MGIETERKFLVNKEAWNSITKGPGVYYRQGYVSTDPDKTIRVRIAGDAAFLTIKGITTGASRPEYEYEIPVTDAEELLAQFCSACITKIRYKVMYQNKLWEVDEFMNEHAGLVMAEIELSNESEPFGLPEWAGEEVTGDKRYYNSYLAHQSYTRW